MHTEALSKATAGIGNSIFKDASPAMILAMYVFLQTVHYSIWVIAIPLVTQSWTRWRLDRLPALRNRLKLRIILDYVIALGAVSVVAFWVGFKLDYSQTMDLYILLTTLHVLAEVPFMFWMYEA